jgi:hypothetical protein
VGLPVSDSPSPSRSAKVSERVCVVCEKSLAHHRSDARCCSGACRAERSRILAILSGNYPGPYDSLAARISARQKRTKRAMRTLTAAA